jgi:hypothetical protein
MRHILSLRSCSNQYRPPQTAEREKKQTLLPLTSPPLGGPPLIWGAQNERVPNPNQVSVIQVFVLNLKAPKNHKMLSHTQKHPTWPCRFMRAIYSLLVSPFDWKQSYNIFSDMHITCSQQKKNIQESVFAIGGGQVFLQAAGPSVAMNKGVLVLLAAGLLLGLPLVMPTLPPPPLILLLVPVVMMLLLFSLALLPSQNCG